MIRWIVDLNFVQGNLADRQKNQDNSKLFQKESPIGDDPATYLSQ